MRSSCLTGIRRAGSVRRAGTAARTLALLLVLPLATPLAAAGVVRIVGPADSSIERLSTSDLRAVYLDQTPAFDRGLDLRAVDLPKDAPARQTFSRTVLERSAEQVESFWQRRIFEGKGVPPAQLESEEAVLRFVSETPNGVGYVGPDVRLPAGVREIPLHFFQKGADKISGDPPAYPPMARRARAEGTVQLRVWLDASGSVVDIDVLEGQAFGLGKAAADAVRDWTFRPGEVDGEAVPSVLFLSVDFTL